jgi:hydroxypyruvate reductase
MEPSRFFTETIQSSPWGAAVARILAAAIEAVDPEQAVYRWMRRREEGAGNGAGDALQVGSRQYNLNEFRRVFLIGVGKAAAAMASAADQILRDRISGGLIVVKEGYAGTGRFASPVAVIESGHPLPDERGVVGARRMIALLEDTRPDDLILCLISGGGSALLPAPPPGVTLADLQSLTAALLASGANISEINTLRKHLDRLKGGQLARLAAPAHLITLILSDVVGDPLDVIASGPTVPDPTTFADAREILDRYRLLSQVPAGILAHLERGRQGEIPENPGPDDPLFRNVDHFVIGNNLQAADAAVRQAGEEGFAALLLTTFLQGEARQAGRTLAAIARQVARTGQPVGHPACLVAGGETTVTLQGEGRGGRNQELALAAVTDLAGLPDVALVTLATDGGDGPTDAAGAVATGETLARARQAGLDPSDYLARNDSYHFFAALGDLLKPGPTMTNVNDLAFLFAF